MSESPSAVRSSYDARQEALQLRARALARQEAALERARAVASGSVHVGLRVDASGESDRGGCLLSFPVMQQRPSSSLEVGWHAIIYILMK